MNIEHGSVIGGNAKVVRSINRSGILNIIREMQPISRVTISKLTGLNKSTVSNIVTELLEEDLIYEEMLQDQNVGRNPLQLRLKLGRNYVGAINLDSAVSRVAIADIDGTFVARDRFDTRSDDPEGFVNECIDRLIALAEGNGAIHLQGIGVSIAGLVDVSRDVIINAPNIGWKEFDIGKVFHERLPRDMVVRFQNDAKASALAELWFGRGPIKEISNFVFLTVGIGIGTGVMLGKNVLDGYSNAAGEFGHMTMFPQGEYCGCGNYGCFEAYASDRATVVRYNRLKKQDGAAKLLEDVLDRAGNNDPLAIKAIKETGYYLGMGIANIIKSLDPEAIVVGGKIVQKWDIIYPEILRAVNQHTLFGIERNVRILPTSLTVRPRLLGAATLALKEIFHEYKIVK